MEIKFGEITMSAPVEKYIIKSFLKYSGKVSSPVSMPVASSPENSNNLFRKSPLKFDSYFKEFMKQMSRVGRIK